MLYNISKYFKEKLRMSLPKRIIKLKADFETDLKTGFKYKLTSLYTHTTNPHTHEFHEMQLILEPVECTANDVRFHYQRGDLIFTRMDDIHDFVPSTAESAQLLNITFSDEIAKELFSFLSDGFNSQVLLEYPTPPMVTLQEADIKWVLSQIDALNIIPHEDILMRKYRFRIFIFKLFTRYFVEVANKNEYIPAWLLELDYEMKKLKNFSQHTDHMVELSGKNRSYLGRQIKKYYGKTLSEYINDLRLTYWANTLINSETPILDICYECGFQNVSWAYKLFNEKFGVSPSKYRNVLS